MGIAMAALVMATDMASAQRGSAACAPGTERVPTIGIVGISCAECSVEMRDSRVTGDSIAAWSVGGSEVWHFEREPEITAVDRAAGPDALREGDRIVAIDGLLITTQAGSERFSRFSPGERVRLHVRRAGALRELQLEAYSYCRGGKPADGALGPLASPRGRSIPALPNPVLDEPSLSLPRLDLPDSLPDVLPEGTLGFGIVCRCRVESPSAGMPRWRFEQLPEVVGIEPGGPAARAGLRPGDVLLEIDGVSLLRDAGGDAYSAVRPGQVIRLGIRRNGTPRVVALTVGAR
jgi:membrane-associated protease RseP (regulator of RpoE activity)